MRPAAGPRHEGGGGGLTLYAGTSGFSYPGWRGRFYPEKLAGSKMLAHYAERLNGVELNGTFYRAPAESALRGWSRAPQGFLFCLKAHRALTYSAAAFPKEEVARDLARRLDALGDRLGPILLQFPPTKQADPGLLRMLLAALGRPVAAEFRHQSWFTAEVGEVLGDHGCCFAVTDDEKWPQAPGGEHAFAYYRLRRDYGEGDLEPWAGRLRSDVAAGRDVHAYFKHEAEGPFRALELRRLVERATPGSG